MNIHHNSTGIHKPRLFGEFGEIALCQHSIEGQMWQPDWPAISAVPMPRMLIIFFIFAKI